MKPITHVSRYLFRFRAAIGVAFFILLIFFARPVSTIAGHILILAGLLVRLWAAGYIGPDARKQEFFAKHRLSNGPYRFLKHPLYFGNLLLVLGVLILYNPPRWLSVLYVILFMIMYTLITVGESEYIAQKKAQRASFKLSNLKGEISTLLVLFIVYVLYWVSLVRNQ